MSDIVERLRKNARLNCGHDAGPLMSEAAGTIEFLRRENAELEARVAEDDARWNQLTIRAASVPNATEYLDRVTAFDHLSRALTYIKRLPNSDEAQRLLMETYVEVSRVSWANMIADYEPVRVEPQL
jgi:hypothetical protein